jgi:DNA modification methylase
MAVKILNQASGKNWIYYHADCVEAVKELPDNKIHYSIFSPPFASLYTYSNSERDMGNTKDDSQFMEHFEFLVEDLFRVTMPGRLCSFHCMNLPMSKQNFGEIGIRDFRGELIRLFVKHGWIFHSEVVIWKDPVTAMQRTKALGLLHKQIEKDSCMSRQGIPDYLVTMRKPGNNSERVSGQFEKYIGDEAQMIQRSNNLDLSEKEIARRFSIDVWQRYASPVWMDINPSNTLQKNSARDELDERHICPLQLQVIERAVQLWSNPGDTVLSPFGGIASEGYQSVKMGRKFIGVELKQSYWVQGVANLEVAEQESETLF